MPSKEYYKQLRGAERLVGQCIVLERKKNSLNKNQLGITVSRRFGKAHQRNRFKRIVRAAYRNTLLPTGWNLNIRPKPEALAAASTDIARDLSQLFN